MEDFIQAVLFVGYRLFSFAAFYFLLCSAYVLLGTNIKKEVKEGRIKDGPDYFPKYFRLEGAFHFTLRVLISFAIGVGGLVMLPATIRYGNTVAVILALLMAVFGIRFLVRIIKNTRQEFRNRYGDEEGDRVLLLCFKTGLPDAVRYGWGLVLVIVLVGFYLLATFNMDAEAFEQMYRFELTEPKEED